MTDPKLENDDWTTKIGLLRASIDRSDRQLVSALSQRLAAARDIAKVKAAVGLPAVDKKRFEAVLTEVVRLGAEEGVNSVLLRDLWERIHEEACRIEGDVIAAASGDRSSSGQTLQNHREIR